MKNQLLENIHYRIRNWWVSLVLGILFIGLAIWMMLDPSDTFVALAIVFSIVLFISGILETIFAISNKDSISGWGWYLAGGVIDVILGLVLILLPPLAMAMIPFLIAFWLMFRGLSSIAYAIDVQRFGSKDWGWYLIFGLIAVICSIGVIWMPGAGVLTAVYITAFAFMFIGIFRIMFAFDLRKIKKNPNKFRETIEEITDDLF